MIEYDNEGAIVSTTDRMGRRIDYAYDSRSRLVSKTLLAGTPDATTVTFTYDAEHLGPTRIETSDSILTFTYDALERVTSASTAGSPHQPDVTINYTYNSGRRLASLSDPFGQINYTYNQLGRMNRLTTSTGDVFTFIYDLADRMTGIALPNGTETLHEYDILDRNTRITHQTTGGTAFSTFLFAYNKESHVTSLTQTRTNLPVPASIGISRDMNYRITGATGPLAASADEAYTYALDGNRLTRAGQTTPSDLDADDRLLEDHQFIYTYDANGNRTSRVVKGDGIVTRYGYDAENRLVLVEKFASQAAPAPSSSSSYVHDGLGRRILKDVDGRITRYVYDGEDILLEYDGNDQLLARYIHGPLVDQPLSMERDLDGDAAIADDERFYYHAGKPGSVVDLTDDGGAVVQSYVYDSFGNIAAVRAGGQLITGSDVPATLGDSSNSLINPYAFTGREFDPETSLYHYRARTYDPLTGRFLQQDIYAGNAYRLSRIDPPVRNVVSDPQQFAFSGGQRGHYTYIDNLPLWATDPSGMGWWSWWCSTVRGQQVKEGTKMACTSNAPLGAGEGLAIIELGVEVSASDASGVQLFTALSAIACDGEGCYSDDTQNLAANLATAWQNFNGPSHVGGALAFQQQHAKEFAKLKKLVQRDKRANGCK